MTQPPDKTKRPRTKRRKSNPNWEMSNASAQAILLLQLLRECDHDYQTEAWFCCPLNGWAQRTGMPRPQLDYALGQLVAAGKLSAREPEEQDLLDYPGEALLLLRPNFEKIKHSLSSPRWQDLRRSLEGRSYD